MWFSVLKFDHKVVHSCFNRKVHGIAFAYNFEKKKANLTFWGFNLINDQMRVLQKPNSQVILLITTLDLLNCITPSMLI